MKKIILFGLICILIMLPVSTLKAFNNSCGCSESYMGAPLVEYMCAYVGGELQWSQCYYQY